MGELCHFFGREHVCSIFTWPASASGNFLLSYTTTTESAAYAVSHFAKTIRMIAQTPGVQGVHLLAHSRGSAVLLNAMRELAIEIISAGVEPKGALKLVNVVLMAPDIDLDVASQQMQVFASDPDRFSRRPRQRIPRFLRGRWTIYSSPQDKALFVSRFLFRSRARVGQLSLEEIRKAGEGRGHYQKWGRMDIVIYQGERTDLFGHSYFLSNPQVSSDLVQLVRFGRELGEAGRPLKQLSPMAWTFPGSDVALTPE